MSSPSDEHHDDAKQETRPRSSGRKTAAKSDIQRLKEARANAGVNRANVRCSLLLLDSHRRGEYFSKDVYRHRRRTMRRSGAQMNKKTVDP